jgi:putative membrane protein
MKFLIIALAIGTMALSSAFAEEAKVTKPQQFADLATVANMFEVQSSELAVKQATDPITREFAKHILADYSRAGEDIKSAAEADKVTLPTQLDDDHQAKLAALTVAKGSDFDKAYLTEQLAGC